jgi:hypothetical protein
VDIKLGTTFTLFQPGRKRLNPSYFLCVFRDTDANETRAAITQSIGDAVGPLLLELTEGTSDPLDGVVQLYSGDWVLTVYEQTSATNLDAGDADRNVWTELVRVSAQCDADPGPEPYDPCAGCEGVATTVNGEESDTPTITVLQGGIEVGTLDPATGVVTIDECPEGPCDPVTVRTTDGSTVIATPDAGTNYDLPQSVLEYVNSSGANQIQGIYDTLLEETELKPDVIIPRREIFNDDNEPLGLYVTLLDLLDDTVPQVPAPTPCDDATLTWDGEELLTIPSGGTQDLDCNTLVNAAYAQDGGSVTGTYKPDGTLNSREVFRLDPTHNFEYIGTRWRLVKPGNDYNAAVGSETKPWDADWTATPVTVMQATIGAYCDDCVPCDDANVEINGTAFDTVAAGGTLDIPVVNTAATPVGTVTPGVEVVVPDATIEDQDSNPIDSVPSGGTYQVIVLSGIDGGASNTIYTNSIIQP